MDKGGKEMKDKITRKIMEQFEEIRESGVCNMMDRGCVQSEANDLEFDELASLDRKEYVYILSNYGDLTEEYNI